MKPAGCSPRAFLPRRALLAVLVLCAHALSPLAVRAQVGEYELKAEFLERFTRFIDWPPSPPDAPFVIGVLGKSPLAIYLKQIADSRPVKGRKAELRILDAPEQASSCHIVFVAGSEAASLKQVLAQTAGRPILTVGDTRGFAESGVLINFFSVGDTLRFEVNEPAAQKSGLVLSAKLLQLARVVRGEGS